MEIATDQLALLGFVFDDWPAVFVYQEGSRYLEYYP